MTHDEMSEHVDANDQEEFDPYQLISDGYQPMLEENSYEFLIAKTRLDYFREIDEQLKQFFKQYHLKYEFSYEKAMCSITNTFRTTDPTSVLIARQMLRLLTRYMEFERAKRVFEPGVESEVFSIDLCSSKEVFLKRRSRFIGSNGQTLTALELLTNTNMKVYGTTAAAVGTPQGLKLVERIVKDCFGKNVLPSFWIKTLMIRRELEKMPEMKEMDWSNFMPKLPKSNGRRRKSKPIQHKKPIEERPLHDVGKFAERKEDRQMALGIHKKRHIGKYRKEKQ